jgi:DNA-binding GntR family transcriptional regulator
MLETGACELAAQRITDAELKEVHARVEDMRAAHEANDLARFVAADLAFHDLILQASENVFVAVLFEPLHRVLEKRRTETSQVPQIQEHAIGHHQNIADALAARDPQRARNAMDSHMQQTLDDPEATCWKPGRRTPSPSPLLPILCRNGPQPGIDDDHEERSCLTTRTAFPKLSAPQPKAWTLLSATA